MDLSEDYYAGLQETTQKLIRSTYTTIKTISNSIDYAVNLAYMNRLGRPVGSTEELSYLALDELNNFLVLLKSRRFTDDSKEVLLKHLDNLEKKYEDHPTTPLIAKSISYAILPLNDNLNQTFEELKNKINKARDKNEEYTSHITYHKELEIKIKQHINSTREIDKLLDKYSKNLETFETFEEYEQTNSELIDAVEFYLFGEIPTILLDLKEKDFNFIKPYIKPLGFEINDKLKRQNISFSQKRLDENKAFFHNNFRYKNHPQAQKVMNEIIDELYQTKTRFQY